MSDADTKLTELVEEFDALKDRLRAIFEDLGLGKDELLRVHGALDVAAAAVRSHALVRGGHDLNDDLAERPEDHPAVQGQPERQEISFDEPAADPEVPNQNPERRVGDPNAVEPELPAGDPVRLKDDAETPVPTPAPVDPAPVDPQPDPDPEPAPAPVVPPVEQ